MREVSLRLAPAVVGDSREDAEPHVTASTRNATVWCAVSIGTNATERKDVIEEGKPAPDFELTSDSGDTVKLRSFAGKPVVLYFYPKDDTPGCTTQACGIRDAYGEFERAGAVVLGVSPDDESSHVKFRRSTSCRSRCSPTRITRSPSSTASGARRSTWARRIWA